MISSRSASLSGCFRLSIIPSTNSLRMSSCVVPIIAAPLRGAGPRVRVRLFARGEIVTLIHRHDAGETARAMVEQPLDGRELHAEPGQAAGEGAAQVVKGPGRERHADYSVEPSLGYGKAGDRSPAVGGESEWTVVEARQTDEDIPHRRHDREGVRAMLFLTRSRGSVQVVSSASSSSQRSPAISCKRCPVRISSWTSGPKG